MRLVTVTLWILLGAALTGAAYWSFLITPESTIWMLIVSAVLLLTTCFVVSLTLAGVIVGWRDGVSAGMLRTAIAAVPAAMPAALLVGAIWWATSSVADVVAINSGPINAWFIATLGWDDVSWLFTGIDWLASWLKWVVAPLLGLAMMGRITLGGWPELAGLTWLRHGLAPINLAVATLLFAAFVAAPWIYLAPWRPTSLPATTVELVFIIVKLSVVTVLMSTGAALIIRQATLRGA